MSTPSGWGLRRRPPAPDAPAPPPMTLRLFLVRVAVGGGLATMSWFLRDVLTTLFNH